jgi:hypothetical protein
MLMSVGHGMIFKKSNFWVNSYYFHMLIALIADILWKPWTGLSVMTGTKWRRPAQGTEQ